MSEEFETVKIVQNDGPTLRFRGQLLASSEFGARDKRISLEVWQTEGGALIAVNRTVPADDRGPEHAWASVVEPMADEQAMHFAVMDHFEWAYRARQMVGKQLGWKLTREVA